MTHTVKDISELKPGMYIKQMTKNRDSVWFKKITRIQGREVWGISLDISDNPKQVFDIKIFNGYRQKDEGYLFFDENLFEIVDEKIDNWKKVLSK